MMSKQALEDRLPIYHHYDYALWRDVWRSVRHAMVGEVEIKRHSHHYLPRPSGMDDAQFAAYKDRAVFYNMVYRTVVGLTGAVFRRDPRLKNAGPKLTALMKRISKDGLSMTLLAKVATQDMLATGRYGILADKNLDDGTGADTQPYLASYTAENILDWTSRDIDGRYEVDYILLREFKTDRRLQIVTKDKLAPNVNYGRYFVVYRVLRLVQNEDTGGYFYVQELYERPNADATLEEEPTLFQPLVYGVPMNRIPFRFFNALTNLPDIEKPPILDILTLNMHHYKVYAQLQHARYFTANPVYYVSGAQEEDEYHIGPSVVWEIGTGQTAGVIEYKGQGLESIQSGLDAIEEQVASIGGRMVGNSPNAGQSDNQVKLKDRNEQSLLLNVTTVLNENFTELLQICASWMNEDSDDFQYCLNQDFLVSGGDARQFRAVQQMYQAGLLPLEVVFEYFLANEVIPDYMSLEQFRALIENTEGSFPNQADVAAMANGYHNATDEMLDRQFNQGQAFSEEQSEADRAHDESLQDTELEHQATQSAAQRTSALKIAKSQPRIPAVPGQANAANVTDPNRSPGAPPQPSPVPIKGPKAPRAAVKK